MTGLAVSRARSPYADRFRSATAILIGLAIAALVVAVTVLVTGPSPAPLSHWSAWVPRDGGLAGESEIANQIAPFYRASPSTQLVVVTVQNYSSNASAGAQVAIKDPATGNLTSLPGNTAVYSLCGLGLSCAIAAGTPSAQRLLLLRREALELSLYTFRYISGVDNVIALLPPGHPSSQITRKPPTPGVTTDSVTINTAIAFQRSALAPFVNRPLSETLPEQLPPTVDQIQDAPEAELVDIITGQALFTQQLVQSQAGGNVLVLTPQPPQ
jgi:hypothetical protein